MSEDLEQLGALFCAFFIVFAYDFALWVYQITSFVIFYLIDTLLLNVIRFKNVWNLHIFVAASAAFFITWFVLSINSPELDLVENVEDNSPLLQQVSENSLLFGDLNNEGNNDTAQKEKSVKDVSVNTSVCDNEMDSTDCDVDVVQSQQTSVKSSDSNEYADCNETVQVSATADGRTERQDIHEVCSDNAARSTVQTSIGGDGAGSSHTNGIHNNSDHTNVVSLSEAQVTPKDKDDIKGGCIASENDMQSTSNAPSGDHGNNDSQDDVAAEDYKISSSSVAGFNSADKNNNQDGLTDKEVDMINTSSSLVTSVHDNNDAQDDITDKEVGKSNTSFKAVVTGVHGNNDRQDKVSDKEVGKINTSSKGSVASFHDNNSAVDLPNREDYKSNSSSKQDGLSVHGDKDDLSEFISSLHRDPVISIEVNDIDLSSSDDELTLCSSTCTLVSETADRLADLLSSSSHSSIASHDSMGDADVDELNLNYWGKLLASIAERLSIKSLRYGKIRILYKDPNADKPAVDVTPWGVALVHAAKEYIETGFLERRMVLPPWDTMYDQVEKHLLDNDTLDIKTEQDATGQLNQSSVDTEWAMEIPQGSQIIIGAGFTAGLCFLCWRLFKA